MEGYPKYLNTKADYIYVKNNFLCENWKPDFQRLLDDRLSWINQGLTTEVEGITDETHKVIENKAMGNEEETQYFQFEYTKDVGCKLFRLGFTVAEVEEILQEAI